MTEPEPYSPPPLPIPKRPQSQVLRHPDRAKIDADLLAGHGVRPTAERYGVPLQALFAYARRLRRTGNNLAPTGTTGTLQAKAPTRSRTAADAIEVAEQAKRHLTKLRKAPLAERDNKAINGAISAAVNAIKVQGEALQEITRNPTVQVSLTVEQQEAVGLREQAMRAPPSEVTIEAGRWLAAQVQAGEPTALRIVGDLLRMLPSADAATQ